MIIERMTINDAKELSELDKICFAVPWSEKSFADEAQNKIARYFVAKDGGKIIGYGGFWCTVDEGQITNIAVLPEYRKKGVASKILESIILEAEEFERLVLEVRESNTAAIKLYEKFGFCKVGMRKNFYHSPIENAIIMIRGEE